ncbi:hypothetical protein F5Y15DRAFT_395175 [Xylariaceae sp. FL0016]|nr:hypothetical protein F5Y15DRAFT_395175 [Xylariaceae sp. FL0016]
MRYLIMLFVMVRSTDGCRGSLLTSQCREGNFPLTIPAIVRGNRASTVRVGLHGIGDWNAVPCIHTNTWTHYIVAPPRRAATYIHSYHTSMAGGTHDVGWARNSRMGFMGVRNYPIPDPIPFAPLL